MWKESSPDEGRPVAPSSGAARSASRRKRTSFSKEHVELLRATFQTDPYPGISLRESLSQATGLPESRIQVWFQNRRARTLKCKGAKKALWQPDSPLQEAPPPHRGPRQGAPPQRPPPAYPAQVKEEMEEACYYGPPAYSMEEQYGSVFGLVQGRASLGGHSSPSMRDLWSQTSPGAPAWCQSPLDLRSYGPGQMNFVFPGSTEQQLLMSHSTPDTPDSGFWDAATENSPPQGYYSKLEDSWNGTSVEPRVGGGHPPLVEHGPLPELSLQEILGELDEDWLGGNGLGGVGLGGNGLGGVGLGENGLGGVELGENGLGGVGLGENGLGGDALGGVGLGGVGLGGDGLGGDGLGGAQGEAFC